VPPVKPGNSDDNEPDETAQDKAAQDKVESDAEREQAASSKAGEKADTKAEPEVTELELATADAAETEPEPEPEPEKKPAPKTKAKPGGKAEAKAAEAKATETEPLMVELEKAPPISDDEPVMPTAAEARRRRTELPRPRVLQIALYLAIASLIVGIVSVIDLFAHKAELVSGAQDPERVARPLTAEEAERAVSSLLWLYLVVVAALGAFLTLFAYKAQDGVRRARMLALIVTLILLLFHFFFFGSLYGQVSGLFAAITIALMYLPSTREYFGPRQKIR
jgi:hypothetical protein